MTAERDSTMTLDTSRILALAAEIRRVDGGNKSGASELAERLMPFIDAHLATRNAVAYVSAEHLAELEQYDGTETLLTKEAFDGSVPLFTHPFASRKVAVPDGWKLVPVEPTVEMLRAGTAAEINAGPNRTAKLTYLAMLNAAPSDGEGE